MQRGYLREEILASPSSLITDINYYLHQQILPVISRLLEPFDGTDQAFLAQCLGLDSSKYKQRHNKQYSSKDDENNADNDDDDVNHELLFGEESEAFKQCDPFVFPCIQCQTLNFWNAPFIFNEVIIHRSSKFVSIN
jgi:DNA polymerase alpha subunit A